MNTDFTFLQNIQLVFFSNYNHSVYDLHGQDVKIIAIIGLRLNLYTKKYITLRGLSSLYYIINYFKSNPFPQ